MKLKRPPEDKIGYGVRHNLWLMNDIDLDLYDDLYIKLKVEAHKSFSRQLREKYLNATN